MTANPFSSLLGAVIPALYTCFRQAPGQEQNTATLAVSHMTKLVKGLLQAGTTTFYVLGSTGQGMHLAEEFRKELATRLITGFKAARFIIHVGANTLEEAVRLAEHVANLAKVNDNVVGISAKPPAHLSGEEVFAYHHAIAKACGKVPYMAYFIGEKIEGSVPEYAEKLISAGATAVKFTSSDMLQLSELVQYGKAGNRLLVFSGDDPNVLNAAKLGAAGAIGSTYNYLADIILQARTRVVEEDANFDAEAFTAAYFSFVETALNHSGSQPHLYATAREGVLQRFDAEIGESVDPVNLPAVSVSSDQVRQGIATLRGLAAA